jgi:Fe-S cluster assembly iron-binding protein IscA
MVEFTERARDMVLRFAQAADEPKVRIAMQGSPFAPHYEFALVDEAPADVDRVIDFEGFKVVVDELSAARMQGAVVDWVEGEQAGTGFEVATPTSASWARRSPTARWRSGSGRSWKRG